MVSCIAININEIRNEMLKKQINKWANTYVGIGKPAFLTDNKGRVICSNWDADILFQRQKISTKETIRKIDESELNLSPVCFEIYNQNKWFDIKKTDYNLKYKLISYLLIDITYKKAEHQELRISEEKYRLLVTQMQQGLAVCEVLLNDEGKVADFIIVDINDKLSEITGFKKDAVLGKKASEIYAGSSWIEKFGEVAMTGKSLKYEGFSAFCGKHLEIVAYSPIQGQLALVVSDITERKKSEEALKIGEEQFGFVFLEAMSSKLPIVTTNSGSIPEVVGNNNYLIEKGSKYQLYYSLKTLIMDEGLRTEIGRINRQTVENNFEIHKQAAKFQHHFKML
jgi:PAS domain-containing protein